MTHTAKFSPTGLIREALSSRFDQALSALESRTPHSWMMALDRAKVLPDSSTAFSAPSAVRLFIKAAAGAHVTDMDGISYIDLCLGDGTQILGHTHAVVQEAIVAQSTRGWQFDLPADGQLELARLIQSAGAANERVALCSGGDEALAYAVRTARAFTGKAAFAMFTGSASGRSSGDDANLVLPFGHPAAFDQIRRRQNELAAVVIEPVRASDPNLDRAAWLHGLGDVCRASGVLLVLDERQSGFRLAYGGAQEIFGLMPDLVVYGKTIGGGLPLGAVAGRMVVMAARQDTGTPRPVNATAVNPLGVTAGTATLAYLLANRATLYPALNDAGRALADRFNAFARSEHLPVEMRCAGSMFRISFAGAAAAAAAEWTRRVETAFNVLVLNRGVLMLPSHRGFLSAAHNSADIASVYDAFTASLRDLRDDGLFARAC